MTVIYCAFVCMLLDVLEISISVFFFCRARDRLEWVATPEWNDCSERMARVNNKLVTHCDTQIILNEPYRWCANHIIPVRASFVERMIVMCVIGITVRCVNYVHP